MAKTGIIILAAGNSSRLGRPKQVLPYLGKTLITHIADEASGAGLSPVAVVTGAFATEIKKALQGRPVEIVHNPHWEEGMASGIVAGLSKTLTLHPHLSSIILAVCDQPHISADLFKQLTKRKDDTEKGIIACSYANTIGTPVLFLQKYFEQLLTLAGNEGAKKLLRQHQEDVSTLPFPRGHIDIDTEEDYQQLFL